MCKCNICQKKQRELKENVAAALIQMFIIESIDLKTVEILSGRKWNTLSNAETKYFFVPLLCDTLTINKKGSFPLTALVPTPLWRGGKKNASTKGRVA